MVKLNFELEREELEQIFNDYNLSFRSGIITLLENIEEKDIRNIIEKNSRLKYQKPKKKFPFISKKGSIRGFIFIFFAISLFLSCSLVSANLLIEPNPLQESVTAQNTYQFPIYLINNHNFTIYNLSFQDKPHVQFPNIESIAPEQNISTAITVQVPDQQLYEYQSIVSFYYLQPASNTPQTHQVNINNNGIFQPDSLTTRANDQIHFTNIDTEAHHIYSSFFSTWIQPNETYSITLSNIGTFTVENTYYPEEMNLITSPQGSDEYIHNSNYDILFYLNINSLYSETQINVNLLDNNFTVNNNQETEGIIRLTNIGDFKAYNIHLSADETFIDFQENDFDLEIGQTKYATYTIRPQFTNATQTNQNYQARIRTKGVNTPEIVKYLNVFIPLDQELENNPFIGWSTTEFQAYISNLLDILFKTNQTLQNLTDTNVSREYTQDDLDVIFGDLKRLSQNSDLDEKKIAELLDLTDKNANQIAEIIRLYNETLENEKKEDKKGDLNQTILLSLILIFGGGFSIHKVVSYAHKKTKGLRDIQRETGKVDKRV